MGGASPLIWVLCLVVAARACSASRLNPEDRPQGDHLALPHVSPLLGGNELLKSDGPENNERTRLIGCVGPGSLCVDVRDRRYDNGNPVQLYPCRFSDNVNQLWTFKKDGTIRSNGKCLGSYGYTPGDYIMIYDCLGAGDKFKWQLWLNGTIVSRSGLVLTAPSVESGQTLTVDVDRYDLGQRWFLG